MFLNNLQQLLKKREQHMYVFTRVAEKLRKLEEKFKVEIAKEEDRLKAMEQEMKDKLAHVISLKTEQEMTGKQAEKIESAFK